MPVDISEINRAIQGTESVLAEFEQKLYGLIQREQFLNDLITQSSSISDSKSVPIPTNKCVSNALELHFGQAMNLTLLRGDGVRLPIIIPINARVLELQWAVQEAIHQHLTHLQSLPNPSTTDAGNRSKSSEFSCYQTSPKFISWRNVWKTKCLAVINPQSRLPPLDSPSIIARLDVLENRLQESYNLRNGALITFVRRLKRK